MRLTGYTEQEQRAAEDRIARDMGLGGGQGRTPEELEAAGSICATIIVIIACIVIALVFAGCGTIGGLGDDLRQWSDGIKGNVAAQPQEGSR